MARGAPAVSHSTLRCVDRPVWETLSVSALSAIDRIVQSCAQQPLWPRPPCRPSKPAEPVARPVRLERTTCGFEVRRSIQLSYGRTCHSEPTIDSTGAENNSFEFATIVGAGASLLGCQPGGPSLGRGAGERGLWRRFAPVDPGWGLTIG